MKERLWQAEARNRKCITIRVGGIESGWEMRVLLRADAHWDHPDSDRYLQRRHLNEALALDAPVLDFGDLHCIMQAAHDPRRTKGDTRREHSRRDYFNEVNETIVEAHAEWAPIWVLAAQGNHETGVLKHHNIDMTRMFVEGMRAAAPGCPIQWGGYRGWVQFLFEEAQGHRSQKKLYYVHGRQGKAPVTRGVIQTARRAVYLPDADIVVSAHTHDAFRVPIARYRLSAQGREYKDEQLHVQIPSYKDSAVLHTDGWECEHELPPQPTGAMWLVFRFRNKTITVDAERAR